MRLADFILRDIERIIAEWEAFAATRLPAANTMTRLALRDHAKQILQAIAKDLSTSQTGAEQQAKSRDDAPQLLGAPETAAETHGLLRAQSGFDINQMVSEYRALRASVLRLWFEACESQTPHVHDIVRFNEAIDQALTESVTFYTERVEQARNLFLGMLGHDMRTPLQAIQMTAIYLARAHVGTTVSEAAARLMTSGKRMQLLLDDLVAFNRVTLGLGIPINRQPADMAELFEQEILQLRAAHPERLIELQVHGSAVGSWDAVCLQRMLDNLVGNALKYGSQDAPVRVVVAGQAEDLIVEVHNQGEQIDPQKLEGIFDPLKRGLHRGEPTSDTGLGLGLYIARAVAKAHGGDIQVRSNQNETVFVARLLREP